MSKSGEMIKLLSQTRLAEQLDRKRTTLWSLRKQDPDFPKPVKVGKSIAWRSDEVEDYILSRQRA